MKTIKTILQNTLLLAGLFTPFVLPMKQQSPEPNREKIAKLLTKIACSKIKETTFNEHLEPVKLICFGPTHRDLASVEQSNIIKIWDLGFDSCSPVCTATLNGSSNDSNDSDRVTAICFSPSGTMLASGLKGLWSSSIKIWRLNKNGKGWTYMDGYNNAHRNDISSLCFSPDGTLASGSWDVRGHYTHIWRIDQGTLIHNKTKLCKQIGVDIPGYFNDNQTLASDSWDVKIWEKETRTWGIDHKLLSQDGKILAYTDFCSGKITIVNLSGLLAIRHFLKHSITYDQERHLELFTEFPEVAFAFLPDEIKELILKL